MKRTPLETNQLCVKHCPPQSDQKQYVFVPRYRRHVLQENHIHESVGVLGPQADHRGLQGPSWETPPHPFPGLRAEQSTRNPRTFLDRFIIGVQVSVSWGLK